jgi:uncharacterized protein
MIPAETIPTVTRLQWPSGMNVTGVKMSIIVPVLNESTRIESFLRHLRASVPGAEIIVVDGGSSDNTANLASGLCDQVLRTDRGRALQMNAGADAAHGDILWFLHADVTVPRQCLDEIARTLSDPRVVGGFFRLRLSGSRWVYRLTDGFAHYAGLFLRMRCGDHGIFCRRDIFNRIGGFAELPLMEDVEFFRELRRRGRIVVSRERLVASARRYREIGAYRLTFAYGLIATLYVFGTPVSALTRIYERLCCSRQELSRSTS